MGTANVSSMSFIAEIDDPEPPPCGSGARDALLAVMTAEVDAGVCEVTHLIDNGVVGANTWLILCPNVQCTDVLTLFFFVWACLQATQTLLVLNTPQEGIRYH